MTLSDLAALAAEKVPGFERPLRWCDTCEDAAERPGKMRDEHGQTRRCWDCDGYGTHPNDSPAALLMAVALCAKKRKGRITIENDTVLTSGFRIFGSFYCEAPEDSEEAIARAALVALLRAHGVEVPDAES